MFPGPLKNHNPSLVENGVTFAFGLYICSHEFWIILSLFKLSCTTQLLCDIMHMVRSQCLGNTNKKIICAYSIWTFFPVTLELLLVDLWIWDCPVVVLCLFGGREVPFWKFSSTNWSSRDEAPSTLKGPWTAWPWLTRTLRLWGGGMLWVTSQGPLGLFLVSFNSYWLSISISDLISSW